MSLNKIDIESLKIILSAQSSLDSGSFIGPFENKEESFKFYNSYGFDLNDPIEGAELFGIFQESMQFIKRYFLKPDNAEGLDLSIPNVFYTITDVADLSLISSKNLNLEISEEESLWASIIIKVMHTILHTDKDLRYHYFTTIQTQVFDRFYKYLVRDEEDGLYLAGEGDEKIPLHDFETKSNKTRESTIIKLLHKKENVAEELFDRIGVRFITKNKLDIIRVINFLKENYIIITNNIKPSRSVNTMFDTSKLDKLLDENVCEEDILSECGKNDNEHTSKDYKAVHFTTRQLIKYQNPFIKELNAIRQLATKEEDSELASKILSLETKEIAQSIRFFYPYEVQITDIESHRQNTEGKASHKDYKKSQLISAMNRLFKPLLEIL